MFPRDQVTKLYYGKVRRRSYASFPSFPFKASDKPVKNYSTHENCSMNASGLFVGSVSLGCKAP